jgi:predicted DNA-binding transcriptional regulator AlpA
VQSKVASALANVNKKVASATKTGLHIAETKHIERSQQNPSERDGNQTTHCAIIDPTKELDMIQKEEELMTTKDVARVLKISPTTLATYRSRKVDGPKFIKLAGAVRYRKSEVDAWIKRHEVEESA